MLHPTRYFLRLCRARSLIQNKQYNYAQATHGAVIKQNGDGNNKESKKFNSLLQEYKDKITFNSYLEHDKLELGYYKYYLKTTKRAKQAVVKEFQQKSLPPLPVSLRYFVEEDRLLNEESEHEIIEPEKTFQLPFNNPTHVDFTKHDEKPPEIVETSSGNSTAEFDRSTIDKWMTNYEHFDDTKLTDQDDESDLTSDDEDSVDSHWCKYYGTADPNASISNVPCGGCGALLHCSDPAIPGYLPSEIFKNREVDELKGIECQRCHFLKEYNIALDVSVQPEEYEKLLQSIKHVKSLVLLMVDLLDFPCSIWPGIVDIIGTNRPIIIVGNKVDLLPGDSFGYLQRIKDSLWTEINKTKLREANIKSVCLISAKTGYGVEDLISTMFKVWLCKGDVFLVGCTNVGKSSLFNALLNSDYCKVHAVDIIKRATVSRWPGTTLNLLKFPINRLSGWKIYQRNKRLKADSKLIKIEKEIRKSQLNGKPATEAPALIGHIGRSFAEFKDVKDISGEENRKMMVLDEKHSLFARSKWFYDTPGVMHPDQVLSLLSTEELLMTIPKNLIRPQTYYLQSGSTIFIGGLARVDFIDCETPCRFTVFCSESLPITVTKTEDAEEVYAKFLGTELFAVPSGGAERLGNWPGLQKSEEIFEFPGEGPRLCCGDIVLSSVAWMSVTAKNSTVCKVAAWTPGARGIHKRYPSTLPYAINLKGKRVRDTPAYMVGTMYSEE